MLFRVLLQEKELKKLGTAMCCRAYSDLLYLATFLADCEFTKCCSKILLLEEPVHTP